MFKLSRRSYDRLTGVDQRLIYLCDQVIKITPVDFGIAFLGGRRTAKEQMDLFMQGRKLIDDKWVKVGATVTNKDGYDKLSRHQSGQAIDVLPFVNGRVDQDELNYGMIIASFIIKAKELELDIESGAFWKWKDLPHIQLI